MGQFRRNAGPREVEQRAGEIDGHHVGAAPRGLYRHRTRCRIRHRAVGSR